MQAIRTNATGPQSLFAKHLALMKADVEDEIYRTANMTANKWLHFQICLSEAETEAMTGSLAETEHITIQQVKESDCITANEQKPFKKEFSIRLIKFEAW